MTRRSNLTRFMEKVDPQPYGCWLWTASIKPAGYGEFWADGRKGYAHRWAYQAFVGPIPAGLDLDHLCRVRHCVNPAHLEAVTRSENLRRGETGRHRRPASHCRRGHPMAPPFVLVARSGRRQCGECVRLKRAERRARAEGPT